MRHAMLMLIKCWGGPVQTCTKCVVQSALRGLDGCACIDMQGLAFGTRRASGAWWSLLAYWNWIASSVLFWDRPHFDCM